MKNQKLLFSDSKRFDGLKGENYCFEKDQDF